MKIKVDSRDVEKMFGELQGLPRDAMIQAFPFLKKKTPIKTGNARRNTKLQNTTIKSNYSYAGDLDDGTSRQAPDGFTEPTIDRLGVIVNNLTRDINNG